MYINEHMLRQKECVKTIVSTFLCTFCILTRICFYLYEAKKVYLYPYTKVTGCLCVCVFVCFPIILSTKLFLSVAKDLANH